MNLQERTTWLCQFFFVYLYMTKIETKNCKDCNIELEKIKENFSIQKHKRRNKKRGEYVVEYFSSYCKACEKVRVKAVNLKKREEYNRRRNNKYKSDSRYKEHTRKLKRESARKNPEKGMVSRAKKRALSKGYEFDITKEDIYIPKVCPLLDIPLVLGTKGNYAASPSIDRIDPTKGYTKDNIWVISSKANTMKSNASSKELATFARNILTKMI